MRLFLAFLILVLVSCDTTPEKTGEVPRTLVLGLDGIPYSTFKKLQEGGHFRSFQPVAPMVATFPSSSDPNWNRIFDTGIEKGFTKAFFDPTVKTTEGMGQDNGGLTAHLNRHTKYEIAMDYNIEGIWEHLTTFIWTESTALYWIDQLQEDLMAFRGRDTYFAFIVNSDLLAHTVGELKLMKYLVAIDENLEKIQSAYRKKYGRDLEVVIVSDHGNAFHKPEDVPFEPELEKQGWKLNWTLAGPKDVGFYVPELLSFGSFFCFETSKRELAVDLSKVEHINVTAYFDEKKDEVRVISKSGTQESGIKFDSAKSLLSYRSIKGVDPLGHLKFFKNGPLNPQTYFELSEKEILPYAVMRLWDAFHVNSEIKPQVLADAELGYVFGNKALRLLTDIRGFASSHGSLHRDESLGIFVSTKRQFPSIRPEDFRNHVGVPGQKSNLVVYQ